MRRTLVIAGIGLVLVLVLVAMGRMSLPSVPTEVDRPPTRSEVRRTTFQQVREELVREPDILPVEQDTPERLQYRADLGAAVAEVGRALVECALRDPVTGGEVGRFLTIVNLGGTGTGAVSVEDDLGRKWRVSWTLPEGANHTTCVPELVKYYTLVVEEGESEAPVLFCGGMAFPGPNEMATHETPCTLVGDGVEPVEVPEMREGDVYTVVLRYQEDDEPDAPSVERTPEEEWEDVRAFEEVLQDLAFEQSELVEAVRRLRDRTPEGEARELLDLDLESFEERERARWRDADSVFGAAERLLDDAQ